MLKSNARSTKVLPLLLLLAGFAGPCFSQENAPALIPRKVFDSAPEHDRLTISPDGKMLAYIAPSDKGVAHRGG